MRYEYGPFAEPIRTSGAVAKLNPIRFSTQYADDVNGDIKYLYRDYITGTGRWKSRDPIEEIGYRVMTSSQQQYPVEMSNNEGMRVNGQFDRPKDLSIYGLAGNDRVNELDILGLYTWCGVCKTSGASVVAGIQLLECFLSTACQDCTYEDVLVGAHFYTIGSGLIPINHTRFRTCFETPGDRPFREDYKSFNGPAKMVGASITPGKGKSFGKIELGDAVSEGFSDTSGFDLGLVLGNGRRIANLFWRLRSLATGLVTIFEN